MYHPTTRVLTILEVLQAWGRVSGPELATHIDVDIRTLRRYIALLQEFGIPIAAGRGRYGAYQLRPGFKLPPLMVGEDEALALTLGLLLARRLGLAAAAPALDDTLAKLERVMPATLRARVGAVQETLSLDIPAPAPIPTGEVVVAVSTAAQRRQQVWMRYRSRGRGEETARVVDPYGLVYRAHRWYLVGYCHLRAAVRVFRLDRVLQVEPRAATFVRPPDIDPVGVVERALATMPGTWSVEALLDTTLDEARQRIAPSVATLEQEPDGVVLRCQGDDLRALAHLLAGLGCPLIIRRPRNCELHVANSRTSSSLWRTGRQMTRQPRNDGEPMAA